MDPHASQVIQANRNVSTAPPAPRHPLGLPAGSVRALLALMAFGIFWALLLLPEGDKEIRIPLYLYYLLFLILGCYFSARGHATQAPGTKAAHPLHLPRGSLRLIMIAGFVGSFAWGFYNDPNILKRLNPLDGKNPDALASAYLPALILGAFFLGLLFTRIAQLLFGRPGQSLPAWYQDVQAWISLLAMVGFGVEIILRLVIYPRAAPDRQFNLPHWEGFLAALVSFYFGARSSS